MSETTDRSSIQGMSEVTRGRASCCDVRTMSVVVRCGFHNERNGLFLVNTIGIIRPKKCRPQQRDLLCHWTGRSFAAGLSYAS